MAPDCYGPLPESQPPHSLSLMNLPSFAGHPPLIIRHEAEVQMSPKNRGPQCANHSYPTLPGIVVHMSGGNKKLNGLSVKGATGSG